MRIIQIDGFCNQIPGDPAPSDVNYDSRGFSMVSSWVDWKNFTVNQITSSHSPRLMSKGNCIKCHGYKMGTWTEKDLSTQWAGIPIFVVDAIVAERESNKIFKLILNIKVVGARIRHP